MSFLYDFYLDGIYPQEQGDISESSEYKDVCTSLQTLEELFDSKLDSDTKSIYSKLKNEAAKAHALELANAFAHGFKLGGRLVFEVIKDGD